MLISTVTIFSISCRTNYSFVDQRDGNKYQLIEVEGQTWFLENLRFNSPDSKVYENNLQNELIHGRLYSIYEKDSVCPEGWHTSTVKDWEKLLLSISLAQGISESGTPFYEIDTTIKSNSLDSLKILLSGYYLDSTFSFKNLGVSFWTSGKEIDTVSVIYIHDTKIFDSKVYLNSKSYDDLFGSYFCIRCVQSKNEISNKNNVFLIKQKFKSNKRAKY